MAAGHGRRSDTMTDDDSPDLKSETASGSKTDEQELVRAPDDSQLKDGRTEPPETKVQVAILKLSKLRGRALTEEEEADHRRLKEIRAGRHPDTGQRLKPGDRKTLRPRDLSEFQRFLDSKLKNHGALYLSDFGRAMIEAQEHRRRAIEISIRDTLISELSYRATYQKELSAPPVTHNLLAQDQLQRQPSLDALLRTMANELSSNWRAQIERRQRFLDADSASRIIRDHNSGPLGRTTELGDPFALRSLQEEVSEAATTKIIEHWKIASHWSWFLPTKLRQDSNNASILWHVKRDGWSRSMDRR
jgi:hypothetical protein